MAGPNLGLLFFTEISQSREIEDGQVLRSTVIYSARVQVSGTDILTADVLALAPIQPGEPHPNLPQLLARTFLAERVAGHNDLAELTIGFEPAPGTGGQDINTVRKQLETLGHFEEVYRTQPDLLIAPNGIVSNSNLIDIQGTPADINGHPGTFLRCQEMIQVVEIVGLPPNDDLYVQLKGNRNDAPFLGFAAGLLAYLGATSSEIRTGVHQNTHKFLADVLFHLVQVSGRNPFNGRQLLVDHPDGVDPVSGVQQEIAQAIYWRQPFPLLVDFTQLESIPWIFP